MGSPDKKKKKQKKQTKSGDETPGDGEERPTQRRRRHTRRTMVFAAGVLIVTFFGLLGGGLNFLRAGSRTLFLVNGGPTPVEVEVADQTVTVPPGKVRKVFVAEGDHEAKITAGEGEPQTQALTITGGLYDRHFAKQLFVLNVGARAALVWEEASYGPQADEGKTRLHFGAFLSFRGIDHAFAPFPQKNARGTRTRVGIAPGDPATLLRSLPPDAQAAGALAYAEAHLRPESLDEPLLRAYRVCALRFKQVARARGFLGRALGHRPVSVPWHRAYQQAALRQGEEKANLRQEYEALLSKEPRSSALLYLRGRVAERGRALEFYERAIAADAKNGFAWHGKAVHLLRRGAFAEALRHAEQARALRPGDPSLSDLLDQARFAAGAHAALQETLLERLKQAPLRLGLQRRLLEVNAARGDLSGARAAHQRYRQEVQARLPKDPNQLALHSEITLLYLEKRTAHVLEQAKLVKTQRIRARLLLEAHLELDQLDEAAKLGKGEAGTATTSLLLSLAFARQGKQAEATAWRTRAQEQLAKGAGDEPAAARLLQAEGTIDVEQVLDLALAPADKATLLAALADAHPGQKKPLLDAAERLNFYRVFPRNVLAKAIAFARG